MTDVLIFADEIADAVSEGDRRTWQRLLWCLAAVRSVMRGEGCLTSEGVTYLALGDASEMLEFRWKRR